jgi:hypothetical protein
LHKAEQDRRIGLVARIRLEREHLVQPFAVALGPPRRKNMVNRRSS